jgi:hypothetical protein
MNEVAIKLVWSDGTTVKGILDPNMMPVAELGADPYVISFVEREPKGCGYE